MSSQPEVSDSQPNEGNEEEGNVVAGRQRPRNFYNYSVRQKIAIVQEAYSKIEFVKPTAKALGLKYPSYITKWKAKLAQLKEKALVNPHAKSCNKGRKLDEAFEEDVKKWVLEQRAHDIAVRTKDIINHVTQTKPSFRDGDLKKLTKWVYQFLARRGLSIRRVTRVGQKLSGHLKEVQDDTTMAIHSRLDEGGTLHGLDLKYFINMDQTAVYFEMKGNTTVNLTGSRTVSIRDSASNSKRCTVVLAVAADGTKLPPFVIFKGTPGAKIEKDIEEKGWLACVQKKGWFDGRVAQIWIDKVIKPYVKDADGAFLLVDHFSVHLTSEFIKSLNNLGIDVDYIPAGYTCVLQPVDVGVNATFKKAVRDFHHRWCMKKYPTITKTDKLPTPNRDDIYKWILWLFDQVAETSIQKTFASIGFIEPVEADATANDANSTTTVDAEEIQPPENFHAEDSGIFDLDCEVDEDEDTIISSLLD